MEASKMEKHCQKTENMEPITEEKSEPDVIRSGETKKGTITVYYNHD